MGIQQTDEEFLEHVCKHWGSATPTIRRLYKIALENGLEARNSKDNAKQLEQKTRTMLSTNRVLWVALICSVLLHVIVPVIAFISQ